MSEKELSFEASMERLDAILKQLQSNTLSLDDTISLYEEGLKLSKQCDDKLKAFELKIQEIAKNNGGETNEF